MRLTLLKWTTWTLSEVRDTRVRFCQGILRPLQTRLHHPVLLQEEGRMPVMRTASHGRDRRPPGGQRDATEDHHGGFSLDASVLIPDWDRSGLEKLLRYCARPPIAVGRLVKLDEKTVATD